MMVYVSERVKNTVGKGENAGNQHFPLFPQRLQNAFCIKVVKCRDYMVKG